MVTAIVPDGRHPLERLLAPVDAPPVLEALADDVDGPAVVCSPVSGPVRRLTRREWQLFVQTAERPPAGGVGFADFAVRDGGTVAARYDADGGRVLVPFSLRDAYQNYVLERWRATTPPRGVSGRQLNAFYRVKRLIPRRAQLTARRALIRAQGRPDFPRWPYDDSVPRLVSFLVHCLALAAKQPCLHFRWFWPGQARAALILTHDVESAEGLRGSIRVADAEEERGLRSSFNVVGSWYSIDWGVIRELQARGFEIGVHGVFHDRSLFASRKAFDEQQPALREAAERLGATGFRSPATHRVLEWLPELPVTYDCTVPLSDPYEPQPGGCCSPWPYMIDRLVELPYTLPQDHTLFTLMGDRTPERWLRQLDLLEGDHGLVQCVSHPDPGYLGDQRRFAIYTAFLDAVAERPGLWRTLPRDVAAWWRARDAGGDEWAASGSYGTATCELVSGEVVLEPPAPGVPA